MVRQHESFESAAAQRFPYVSRFATLHLAAVLAAALVIGCGSKEPAPTMTLRDAKSILAEEAARVEPMEVTLAAIEQQLSQVDSPRRGDRPVATRAELEQSKAKIEAELERLRARVEAAKAVVEKEGK